MTTKTEIKIKLVELNNKSRKGTHAYVTAKGKPPRYYKISGEDYELDQITQHYTRKYIQRKESHLKTTRAAWKHLEKPLKLTKPTLHKTIRQTRQYIQKIRKRGKITTKIRKGITSATYNPLKPMTNTQKKSLRRKLLKPLVLDKKLLELLIQDENFNKQAIRNKLEYHLRGTDQQGATNLEANKHGISIEQANKEIREATKKSKDKKYEIKKALEKKGWYTQTNIETNQNINKLAMTIIIRAG